MFLSQPIKKNYASVMQSFHQVISDLEEVANTEETKIQYLSQQKKEIEMEINDSENEMKNCLTAISNIQNIFPNI